MHPPKQWFRLLDIFDDECGFEEAAALKKHQIAGLHGLRVGSKPTILDAMGILGNLQGREERDDIFAKEDGIRRCWRKAAILPTQLTDEINQGLESINNPMTKKESDELVTLMSRLQVKATAAQVDGNKHALALQNFFVSEGQFNTDEIKAVADNCATIKDDPEVINAIIKEEMDMILEPEDEDDLNRNKEKDHEVMAIEVPEDDIIDCKQAEEMIRKFLLNCERLELEPYAQRICHKLGREVLNAKANKTKHKTFATDHFKCSPKK